MRAVARVARRQHGIVSRAQLLEIIGAGAVDHRVRVGELIVVHRGVYLVAGAVLTVPAREFAAVLAGGDGSFLSHHSAAYRLDLLPYPARYRYLQVTTRGESTGRIGIRMHRTGRVERGDTFVLDGLRTSTPRRALLELARTDPSRALERALATALATDRVTVAGMLAYVDRHRHRPGAGVLRILLTGDRRPAFTRSEAEELLLASIRASSLPEPRVNARLDRFEVDFLWEDARLVVEVDGWRYHGDREAIERDKARDARLASLGYRVIRVTWRQLTDEPAIVIGRIARALQHSPPA